MKKNTVKRKLGDNQLTVGAWLTLGSSQAAEYMAHTGFDWLLLDAQHGLVGHKDIIRCFRATSTSDVTPLARVSWNEPFLVNRLQDAGAMGIVVPMIKNAKEAEKAVDATRHGPKGSRSAGGGREMLYFGGQGSGDFMEWADRETLVIPMIEQKEAVENIEEILTVDGIDTCLIGPVDLAASMGTQLGEEDHTKAIKKVLKGANKVEVPAGIVCFDLDDAERRANQGFKFISIVSDSGLVKNGAKEKLQQFRQKS